MRQMGHKPETLPRIRSAFAARRAMLDRGWPDVAAMLDSMLPRIAPARMLLGDLAVVQSDEGLGSIMVNVAPRKLIGWREDADKMVTLDVSLDELAGAWNV